MAQHKVQHLLAQAYATGIGFLAQDGTGLRFVRQLQNLHQPPAQAVAQVFAQIQRQRRHIARRQYGQMQGLGLRQPAKSLLLGSRVVMLHFV